MEKDLSIILPSYEEAENLNRLIPTISKTLSNLNHEILVIDTQKPLDNTKEICEREEVRYIPREKGDSFGDAVRTGIKFSKGKIIVFMDADGSHDPEFIPNLLEHIYEYHVVVASRYVEKGLSENNLLLRSMSKILNLTYSFILNIPCKDVSNSFKAYHAEDLKELDLVCNNFDIVEEILFKLSKKYEDIQIKEIPFNFKKRWHGETKRNLFYFVLTYLYTIIKLRFGTKFNHKQSDK